MKVLIIEDDMLNMKLFSDIMTLNGFEPIKSTNGLDAVKLAKKHVPAAILMDMQLPYKSGLQITKEIKADEQLADIPIIALTGFAAESHKEICLNGGCDAYMAKPVSIWQLANSVSRMTGRALPEAPTA